MIGWDLSWAFTLPNRKSRCVSCMFQFSCSYYDFSFHREALYQYIQSSKPWLFQFLNLPTPNPKNKLTKTKQQHNTTDSKKLFPFICGIYRRNLPANGYKMESESQSSDSIIHIFPTVIDLLGCEKISFILKKQWAQVQP